MESPCKSLSRDYLCGLNVMEQVGHIARAWPGILWERLGLQSDCGHSQYWPQPLLNLTTWEIELLRCLLGLQEVLLGLWRGKGDRSEHMKGC